MAAGLGAAGGGRDAGPSSSPTTSRPGRAASRRSSPPCWPGGRRSRSSSSPRDSPGSAEYDAALPYPVVRQPTGMLLPTRATARAAVELARRHGCDSAFFGAAAPLGLLAPALRPAGVGHLVGATHGHETGWVALPGQPAGDAAHRRRSWTSSPTSATTPAAGSRRRWAAAPGWPSCRPGSTSSGSRRTPTAPPSGGGTAWGTRRWWSACPGWSPRKGQDVLVAGWPRVLARHPGARLLLVGGGPGGGVAAPGRRRGAGWRTPSSSPAPVRAERAARALRGRRRLRHALPHPPGGPGRRGAGDGLPRGRRLRPAGRRRHVRRRAGGRPRGRHRARRRPAVARRRGRHDRRPARRPARARAMGAAGRAWVEERWSWTTIAATFAELLEP